MLWRDPLYGDWELPDFIEDLVHTSEMARLRGITQDVLPNRLLPYCMHSRFEHGLGVCFLAFKILEKQPLFKKSKNYFACGRPSA